MANISVPLESQVCLENEAIIKNINTQEKDVLAKKNTLKFRGLLSPMFKDTGTNELYLTSGNKASILGNVITDKKTGIAHTIDNTYTLDKVYEFDNNVIAANIYNNHIYKVVKTGNTMSLYKDEKIIKTYTGYLPDAASSSNYFVFKYDTYSSNYSQHIVIYNISNDTEIIKPVVTSTSTQGAKVYIYERAGSIGFPSRIYIGVDDTDVDKRITYYYVPQTFTWATAFSGWGCLGENGLVTGEPIPFTTNEYNQSAIYFSDWPSHLNMNQASTRLSNGVRVKERRHHTLGPAATEVYFDNIQAFIEGDVANMQASYGATSKDAGVWIADTDFPDGYLVSTDYINQDISQAIGILDSSNDMRRKATVYIAGWDISSNDGTNIPLLVRPIDDAYLNRDGTFTEEKALSTASAIINTFRPNVSEVDFTFGLGNLHWDSSKTTPSIENGCNPFPLAYAPYNRAEAKGKYWDYGPGWAVSMFRELVIIPGDLTDTNTQPGFERLLVEPFPTSIISFGFSNNLGENSIRVTPLDPITFYDDSHDKDATSTQEIVDMYLNPNAQGEFANGHGGGAWMRTKNPFFTWDHSFTSYSATKRLPGRMHWFTAKALKDGNIPTITNFVGGDLLGDNTIINRIPFSIQVLPAKDVRIQYFENNPMSISFNGVLISSASAQDIDGKCWIKTSGNDYYIYFDKKIYYIKKDGSIKISKITDYQYKLNCLTRDNYLYDDAENGIEISRAFIPYNAEERLDLTNLVGMYTSNDNEDINNIYYSASGYNVQMNDNTKLATSYLLPAFQLPMIVNSQQIDDFIFQVLPNKKEITRPYLYKTFTYEDDPVDHYYTVTLSSTDVQYQTSKKMISNPSSDIERLYGIATFDIDKENMSWWITSSLIIFPLGIASKLTGINSISPTVYLSNDYTTKLYNKNNATYLAYNGMSEVYKGSTIFTIYGSNYSFDGQAIYYVGSGSTMLDTNTFAAYALGMEYLANSATEAYFYSAFEKRLYLFTGSNTLQASDLLSNVGEIVDSIFSSHEQILYMLTSDGKIIMKSQNDMAVIENIDPTYHFEGTDTGAILVSGWDFLKFRLHQTDESSIEPIHIESEFLGNNDSLYKVSAIDITLYKNNSDNIEGELEFTALYDIQPDKQVKPFNITKSDWKANVCKIRFVPKNNEAMKAFRFGIKSNDFISIANMAVIVEEKSTNTGASKHI